MKPQKILRAFIFASGSLVTGAPLYATCLNIDDGGIPECCNSETQIVPGEGEVDCHVIHDRNEAAKAAAAAANASAAASASAERDQVNALVSQAEVLNAYLALIPAATAFVNDAKSLTANYLSDNSSVSSVPRNSKALLDRHAKWLTTVSSKLDAGKSAVAAIVDGQTYRTAANTIAAFPSDCHDDEVLTNAEQRFVGDLTQIQSAIAALVVRGNSVSQKLSDARFNGVGDSDFVSNLKSMTVELGNYSPNLDAVKQQVIAQSSKRVTLCETIAAGWKQQADDKLRQANIANATALIASVEADLRGPKIYAMITAATLNGVAKVDEALDFYAPLHAQRAFLAAKGQLAKLRGTVSQASISDDMKAHANAVIDDYASKLATRDASVKDFITRKVALGKERQRLTKLSLLHSASVLTTECSDLAKSVTTATANLDSADSEQRFIDFKNGCAVH